MSIHYRTPLIPHLFSLLLTCCSIALFSEATNTTITQGQLVRDGQSIISAGQNFTLGFFSPENSKLRYVGIWYYRIPVQTVVWVANRDNPISGLLGVFSIGNDGNLVVLDGNSSVVWSTNTSSPSFNSTAVLMDNGNLILLGSQGSDGTTTTLWQSFNNPTDTYLPDMRAYTNARRGESHSFASWRSASDPLPGNYTMGLDPRGSPQIVIWEESQRRWRSGHWNGLIFMGVPSMRALYLYGFRLTSEGDGDMYFTYSMLNDSCTMRFRLRWDGIVEQLIWINDTTEWNVTLSHPSNECELYNRCGNFGLCSVKGSPICSCMRGFEPKNRVEWDNGNWSGGCIRRTPLQCGGNGTGDGFLEVQGVKLADYADNSVAADNNECEEECLRNCSCNAYTFLPGIGCMIWSGDLVDVEHFDDGGKSLFIRLANSELGGESKISKAAVIIIAVLGTPIFLGASIWILFRKKIKAFLKARRKNKKSPISDLSRSREFLTDLSEPDELSIDGKNGNGPQFPLFNFSVIEVATDNFANKNKLGQGGFGPVYKGTLPGGLEIAVKRLSKSSGQGLEEFKNEMILIAKLQHRNLVRVLGCCIEGEEKLLVYEYMPNKSLDSFLFDTTMKVQLDWSKRFAIIMGIARGLIYLHRDSRLRIIHRDLKASNILLDEEMNPKISDFGTARIFGGNQNEANTNRVIGTYGYMSPEYAMEGHFSVKSDVYSFGVLLLEIVSGQRNNSFGSPESSNLIRHAWDLWNDGKAMELIDPSIVDTCPINEVLQCIHVGMLCVQVSAVCRPTMSSVMVMLEREDASLPKPKQPDTSWMNSVDMYSFMQGNEILSLGEEKITDVAGRQKKIVA